MCVFNFLFWGFGAPFAESADEIQGIIEFEIGNAVVAGFKFSNRSFELFRLNASRFIRSKTFDISCSCSPIGLGNTVDIIFCILQKKRTK